MKDKTINKRQLLSESTFDQMIDRQWMDLLGELPDPDPILRKANIDQAVYAEILTDPHVLGEVRKMYAALIGFKHEVRAGADDTQAQKSQQLCQSIFTRPPHKAMRWPDLFWSIGKAPLTGRRVHHVTWKQDGSYLVPDSLYDIPPGSFAFNRDADLLIRTQTQPEGEPAEPMRWLVTRHMPEAQNPYGTAILSACFWPWMFKNGGIKFFGKFCEKFGIPWPVGKYPLGSKESEINELVERLQQMVEDAVAAIPEGVDLQLLESKGGVLPQENLINLMNREMSKAITSQTLATEIQDNGSRAAAQVGDDRTEANYKADRALIADTMNQLFEWITLVNFGPNTASPLFVYVDRKELNTKDVTFFSSAAKLVPLKKADVYRRLELSEPGQDDEVLFLGNTPSAGSADSAEFSAPQQQQEWTDIDREIEQLIKQVKERIEQGNTLEDALDAIIAAVDDVDIDALRHLVRQELELEFGTGMIEAD